MPAIPERPQVCAKSESNKKVPGRLAESQARRSLVITLLTSHNPMRKIYELTGEDSTGSNLSNMRGKRLRRLFLSVLSVFFQ